MLHGQLARYGDYPVSRGFVLDDRPQYSQDGDMSEKGAPLRYQYHTSAKLGRSWFDVSIVAGKRSVYKAQKKVDGTGGQICLTKDNARRV